MADVELSKLLEQHKSELRQLAQHAATGDSSKFLAGAATLVGALASGNPTVLALAPFAEAAVAKAFASAADKRLLEEIRKSESDEERAVLVATIAEAIEALLGQSVLQMVRVQHHVKDELLASLGGMREDLTAFRRDFQQALDTAQVRLDMQRVVAGSIGIQVSAGARERVFVREQIVSGAGSIGVVLKG